MNEIEEIKSRIDIADFIGQYVPLQKAGRSFKAPCPFHSERTPSFIVTPDRQSWHCFGACGTGGDVISFVMRNDGLEFPDALKLLAERTGVKLRERRVSEEDDRRRARLVAANEAAADWFSCLLVEPGGRAALEYLERRGIDSAAAKTFRLGYSPPEWHGLQERLSNSFSDQELLDAGLLVKGDSSTHDRFRGRLMFAIADAKGRVVGFGARALDDSQPKYLNTQQTALFDKGGLLYMLNASQESIRNGGQAVIVEGYMDAIAAHQHGFNNVVAQMGTALTERQVRLAKKLAPVVVLALDADAAGIEAAARGYDVVQQTASQAAAGVVAAVDWRGLVSYQQTAAVELRIATLPAGRDPDDVIRADPEAWRSLIEKASPVLDYRLQTAASRVDLTSPLGRSALAGEFLPLLAPVSDPIVRATYLQKVSRLTGTSERDLSVLLSQSRSRRTTTREQVQPLAAAGRVRDVRREEFVLSLLLRFSTLRAEGLEFSEDLLWRSENRELLSAWKASPDVGDMSDGLVEELRLHLECVMNQAVPSFNDKEALLALVDCRTRLETRNVEMEKQTTGALLAAQEEEIGATALVEATPGDVPGGALARDMEAGLKLHNKERSHGPNAVESGAHG